MNRVKISSYKSASQESPPRLRGMAGSPKEHDEDFQTLSLDCLPLVQLLISNYFNQNNYILLNCLFGVLPLRWVQGGQKNMEIHFKSSRNV